MVNRYRVDESEILAHYPTLQATGETVNLMRYGIVKSRKVQIPNELIRRSKQEVDALRCSLDRQLLSFHNDFSNAALEEDDPKRIVLVMDGKFSGDESFETTIGMDLGLGQGDIFKRKGRDGTIDNNVTSVMANAWAHTHASHFFERGINELVVDASRFFYFRDSDLGEFQGTRGKFTHDGLAKLVRLATQTVKHDLPTYTYGYVGFDYVEQLPKRALSELPRFSSYRLKKSMRRKIENALTRTYQLEDEDSVSDGGALRVVFQTEREAISFYGRMMEEINRGGYIVGNSVISKVLKNRDYYAKPKENGYRAINLVIIVNTTGLPQPEREARSVIEVQLVDKHQYDKNERDPNDPAHHLKQVRKEVLNARKERLFPTEYRKALVDIFGRGTTNYVPRGRH